MSVIKGKRTTRRVVSKRAIVAKPALHFAPHAFKARVEFIEKRVPMVYVTRDAYSRMYHMVDMCNVEVGWRGTVRVTRGGNFLIDEVFLLEQEVSGAATELSEDGQARLVQHLIDTRDNGVEVANELRFWGHSHANMATFASTQDDKQMAELEQGGCPWFIRGILNKLGSMTFDIFYWDIGVKIADAQWAVWDQVDQSMREELEAEFNNKVTRKPTTVYHYRPPAQSVWAVAAQAGLVVDLTQKEDTPDVG